MSLGQILLIIRARKAIFFSTLLVMTLSTLLVSLALPKSYKAVTSLVLNYRGVDAVTGVTLPAQLMPGYLATQIDMIASKSVALKVVDALRFADDEEMKKKFQEDTGGKGDIREWIANVLLKKVDVKPSRESSVLEISVSNKDARVAADIANAFATQYQKTATLLKTEPMNQASEFLNENIRILRQNLRKTQARYTQFQQENGIVSVNQSLDVEHSRLDQISTQLVRVQDALAESMSRRGQATGSLAAESPDIVANSLVQRLRGEIAMANSRLAQMSERVTPEHPDFQRAQAEVTRLRSELRSNMRSVSGSVEANTETLQRRESELRAAFETQKATILKLNRARDELSILGREVDGAQKAYEASMARLSQTSLEGQANQSDIGVLNPAMPPIEAASPKVAFNILLALFMGTLLGAGISVLAEMWDRRVRSSEDLLAVLPAPFLGIMQPLPSVNVTDKNLWLRLRR